MFAGEHPFRFAASLLMLQMTLLGLVNQLPDGWLTSTWGTWGAAEQLSYFSALWAVQATLAALVYPIVIAFVAVFLQRRPAAEAFVHLYMLDSGALVAGLSSVALVVVMGVQFLLLPSWGASSLPGWAAVDSVWFVANAVLTTYFLFRTVEFLRPEVQVQVMQRYAVGVALPRDVGRLTAYQVLISGHRFGWLPIPMFGDSTAKGGPRVYFGRFSLNDNGVHGTRHLKSPHRIVDIRLWPLRLALATWLKATERHSRPMQQGNLDNPGRESLLWLPMVPGMLWESQFPLAKVEDGPSLSRWQLKLVCWSIVLFPTARERYGIQVQAILDELSRDARQAASQADNEAFSSALDAIVRMHELLLNACVYFDEGRSGSWALLREPGAFLGRPMHENWCEVYRGVYESAIHGMTRDMRMLRQLAYLPSRLKGEESLPWPREIRLNLLRLSPLLSYLLGNWWSRRVEEQGLVEHSHLQMVTLRAPLNRVYEEALSHFVGGWEGGSPSKGQRSKKEIVFPWESASERASLSARYIEETAKMLLDAVQRGDRMAAEWMGDILNKWWDASNFESSPPLQLLRKSDFITLDHLSLGWDDFIASFGLADDTRPLSEAQHQQLKYGAYVSALRNFWNDLRLLVVELLVFELLSCSKDDASEALSTEIAVGLLSGKQWRGGGRISASLQNLTAPSYLAAKVRQYCGGTEGWRDGYIGVLDKFVERANNSNRQNMVTSRVYLHGGADDVESLSSAQVAVFGILTTEAWSMTPGLEQRIDDWLNAKPVSIEILRSWLADLIRSCNAMGEDAWIVVSHLKGRARSGADIHTVADTVKGSFVAASAALEEARTEVVATLPIDPDRLLEIARAASVNAFGRSSGEFPMQLLEVESSDQRLKDFSLTLSKVRRGELTRVELDQRAGNEAEFYDEMLTRQVAVVVLSDILQSCSIRSVVAENADLYWRLLKAEAESMTSRGYEAVLLLDNDTRPEWVKEWMYPEGQVRFERPDDLRVQRLDEQGAGYACHFNDIAVYVAPIQYGESLLMSKQTFVGVKFTQFSLGRFVEVSVDEATENKEFVDLKFTFSREVRVKAGEVIRLKYDDGAYR